MDTLKQVLNDEPVAVRALAPKTSPDLETICHKCLLKDAERRYATAAELAEDLRRFQAGEPILARPVGKIEWTIKWVRRNKLKASVYGLVVLVALICILGAPTLWVLNGQLESKNLALDSANVQITVQNKELDAANGKLTSINAQLASANTALAQANEAVQKEKDAAQLAFRETVEYIEVLLAAGTPMRSDAGMLPIHRDFLNKALVAAQKLDRGNRSTLVARIKAAKAHAMLGYLKNLLGDEAQARREYDQAAKIYESTELPSDELARAQFLLSQAKTYLGAFSVLAEGDPEKAQAGLVKGLGIVAELTKILAGIPRHEQGTLARDHPVTRAIPADTGRPAFSAQRIQQRPRGLSTGHRRSQGRAR